MSRYAIQAAAILAGLLAAVEGLFARPAVYRLDPVHTQITFFVDHLGFSRASGRAYGSEGALVFDPEDWSRSCATVRIPVQRIGFGDARWDERMQRSDFFAAAEYPWIEFQGLWLERTGEREGILRGLLRLRGRDAPVELKCGSTASATTLTPAVAPSASRRAAASRAAPSAWMPCRDKSVTRWS